MKNKFLLLATSLMLAVTPMLATGNAPASNNENPVSANASQRIGLQQVQAYMLQFDVMIVEIMPMDGTCNIYGRSDKGNTYIIYVADQIITGWDQVDL